MGNQFDQGRERERNEVEYGNWITGFVLGGLDNYKRNVTRETRAVISSNRNYVSRCRLFLRGIPWTIMSRAFRSCVNLSLEPVDVSRFKIVSNISSIDFLMIKISRKSFIIFRIFKVYKISCKYKTEEFLC